MLSSLARISFSSSTLALERAPMAQARNSRHVASSIIRVTLVLLMPLLYRT